MELGEKAQGDQGSGSYTTDMLAFLDAVHLHVRCPHRQTTWHVQSKYASVNILNKIYFVSMLKFQLPYSCLVVMVGTSLRQPLGNM